MHWAGDTVIVFNVARDAKKVAHPCSNSYYYPYSVIGYRSVDKEPEPEANVDRKAKPLLYMCGYPYILLYVLFHTLSLARDQLMMLNQKSSLIHSLCILPTPTIYIHVRIHVGK